MSEAIRRLGAAARRAFARRHWGKLLLAAIVLVPVRLGLTLWTAIALSYTYSSGDRAGYIQKLSQQGMDL